MDDLRKNLTTADSFCTQKMYDKAYLEMKKTWTVTRSSTMKRRANNVTELLCMGRNEDAHKLILQMIRDTYPSSDPMSSKAM